MSFWGKHFFWQIAGTVFHVHFYKQVFPADKLGVDEPGFLVLTYRCQSLCGYIGLCLLKVTMSRSKSFSLLDQGSPFVGFRSRMLMSWLYSDMCGWWEGSKYAFCIKYFSSVAFLTKIFLMLSFFHFFLLFMYSSQFMCNLVYKSNILFYKKKITKFIILHLSTCTVIN